MTDTCPDCGLPQIRSHRYVWECKAALKARVITLEAIVDALTTQLAAANDTATRINEAWREERAQWAEKVTHGNVVTPPMTPLPRSPLDT
jgi:hypothetical protein